MRAIRSAVLAAIAVLALAGAATGEPPGKWTKVTDPGSNIDELGLVRSPNGLLHVAWPKVVKPAVNTEIWHTRIGQSGIVGGRSLIARNWNAAGGPELLSSPSGIRVLFAGLGRSNEHGGIQSATAGHTGDGCKPAPDHVSKDVNAAGTVGATLLPNGDPIFAWSSGSRLFLHTGVDPAGEEKDLGSSPSCCFGWPELATDEATKVTSLAYASLVRGKGGIFVRPFKPSLGPAKLAPKSLTGGSDLLPDLRLPLVARAGGGVLLAYCSGYPTCKEVLLWRVGTGTPLTVSTATNVEDVNTSRGPEGRIWVMWWNRDLDRIFATRRTRRRPRSGPP